MEWMDTTDDTTGRRWVWIMAFSFGASDWLSLGILEVDIWCLPHASCLPPIREYMRMSRLRI